eukprot:9188841-Pyramimonas_sp.AAC.1
MRPRPSILRKWRPVGSPSPGPAQTSRRAMGFIMTARRSLRARIKGWAHSLGLEVQANSTQLGVDSAGGGVV